MKKTKITKETYEVQQRSSRVTVSDKYFITCSECNIRYNGRDKYWAQHEVNMPAGGGSVESAWLAKDKREFETGKAQIFFYQTGVAAIEPKREINKVRQNWAKRE